ncbi:hypothetical protein QUF50_09165 [Thiotrichales bacterium HSG1]|nr:hypothetical protein [Thiotrichales bacterium HSG1]
MNQISFVVDKLALHYYQAELLLFSLENFAHHPKQAILVQCVHGVDAEFLNFLSQNSYNYRIIEPFLDGKYCNKIQQLEAFNNLAEGNVMLLDTDMFVLEPLNVPEVDLFCGKIVDASNPPLHVIQNIFNEANLKINKIVDTDWKLENSQTIDSNFNGGFYYIPNKHLKLISTTWKKWATWLFNRIDLFENHNQAIHVDQIAMAMTLCEKNISYKSINSNYNCPIHSSIKLNSFNKNIPISLLHYHREITPFGILNLQYSANKYIENIWLQRNIIPYCLKGVTQNITRGTPNQRLGMVVKILRSCFLKTLIIKIASATRN